MKFYLISLLVRKFKPAISGMNYIIKDKSIMIQFFIGFITILLSLFLRFKVFELILVLFLISFIIALEIINTAIENLCDLYSLEYNERIKKIKDIMSAVILFSGLIAVIIFILLIIY